MAPNDRSQPTLGRKHRIDAQLDQTEFNLGPDQSEAVARTLQNRPAPTDKLRKLMRSKAPWE
jgi:uncharacterized protein (DUF1778 family)